MTKKPDYYQTPLRSRKDIVAFIFDATHQRIYDHRCHPFCFNVKCYNVDFSFDHLLEIFREMEGDPKYTHNNEWLATVRERFPASEDCLRDRRRLSFTQRRVQERTKAAGLRPGRRYVRRAASEDCFWEWGLEHARSNFVGRNGGEPESDCYTHLWDGTKIDVEYSFEGRSGGWLAINKFQGLDFTRFSDDYWWGVIETAKWDDEEEPIMDYKTVRQLYQLVTMLEHDLRKPCRTVEEGAAWDYFVNVCADVPQPDASQGRFAFMEEICA